MPIIKRARSQTAKDTCPKQMIHLRHRLHTQEDDDDDAKKEHRRHDLNWQKTNDLKGHHHQHYRQQYMIASFCRRIIIAQTSKLTTKLTSQEWILRLLLLSFFLFVLSVTILVIWLMFFPQDSPSTHIDLFLRSSGGNKNKKDMFLLSPQLPLLDNIKVSVVIMNHNRPRLLQQSQLLPTLIAHPNVHEILLLHSNPTTQFDYYKDYYYYNHNTTNNNQTGSANNKNKIININAIQTNKEMGLSLRFHYCAQQAQNEYVIMIDDDQEITFDAITHLILEFTNNSSSNNANDKDNKIPYNPYRIVGRYGRVYHEKSTLWSWYHVGNHGYDTRTYTGRVEVVLTKFMILHRTTCRAFFYYQHLIWHDLILPSKQQPLWNGEDIFMSLVANHLYQKHQIQQQQQQKHQTQQSSHNNNIIIPFNNYATSSLDVWEAPAVDELDDNNTTSMTSSSSSSSGNSKTGISGNMDRHVLFWNVGWTEYWQIKARARAHIHYRGLLWFTARQRLAELLQLQVPTSLQEEEAVP